jgi:hypothetical protein
VKGRGRNIEKEIKKINEEKTNRFSIFVLFKVLIF